MAEPTTREEFKEYCLRKLGKPVIEINVANTQVEDRIDEALSYYADYHYDATEVVYYKQQITANNKVDGYITLPENIIGAVEVFPLNGTNISNKDMFSAEYQFMLNNVHEIAGYDLVNYYMNRMHLETMQEILSGEQPFRYNRHANKLYIDTDWDTLTTGNYIIVKAYQIIDPDTYSDIWKDRWLQNYATVLIKEQWGNNLTKFSSIQLTGGVQFNGDKILDEARTERQQMEETMLVSFSPILHDLMG